MYVRHIYYINSLPEHCHSVLLHCESGRRTLSRATAQAQEIASKFQRVFQLFRDCHVLYDAKAVSEEDVKQLGKGFLA